MFNFLFFDFLFSSIIEEIWTTISDDNKAIYKFFQRIIKENTKQNIFVKIMSIEN